MIKLCYDLWNFSGWVNDEWEGDIWVKMKENARIRSGLGWDNEFYYFTYTSFCLHSSIVYNANSNKHFTLFVNQLLF